MTKIANLGPTYFVNIDTKILKSSKNTSKLAIQETRVQFLMKRKKKFKIKKLNTAIYLKDYTPLPNEVDPRKVRLA